MRRLIVLAVAISSLSWGCINRWYPAAPPPGALALTKPSEEKTLPEWIGKSPRDLVDKMGQPKMMVPMESGAKELYYSYEGHKYYFETDLRGNIKTAVRID